MTANHTKCNQKQPEVSTFCNLTEQWKKGELPYGYYYIKTISGGEVVDRYYRDCTDYDLCEYGDVWENHFEDEIIQVLAPVPHYEEWQELGKKYDNLQEQVYAQAPIHLENQQLKELLKECKEFFHENLIDTEFHFSCGLGSDIKKQSCIRSLSKLKTKIDNTIGEKK